MMVKSQLTTYYLASLYMIAGMDVCIWIWSLVFVILTILLSHDYYGWKFNLYIGKGIRFQLMHTDGSHSFQSSLCRYVEL